MAVSPVQAKLKVVEDWGRWVADAIEGVSFDSKGNLGFRTGEILTDPTPRSRNPSTPCDPPGRAFVLPKEFADVVRDMVVVVVEVRRALEEPDRPAT